MTTFRVSWDIDVEPEVATDVAAAQEAHRLVRKPNTTANVYKVENKDTGVVTTVDLNDVITTSSHVSFTLYGEHRLGVVAAIRNNIVHLEEGRWLHRESVELVPAQHKVTIRWGKFPEPDDRPETFEFETAAELAAFMQGVEAMSGWMEYEVVTDG